MISEPVLLSSPDPSWAQKFAAERERILAFSGDKVVAVEHIGSTAVSSLAAKPIVDLLVGVRSVSDGEELVSDLGDLGYVEDSSNRSGRFFLRRVQGARTFHLHLVRHGDTEWQRQVLFRNALRTDPWLAARYQNLKHVLARRHPKDGDAYARGKATFIASVLRDAMPS